MHVIAAKAVALKEAMTDEFKLYQEQIVKNARALAVKLSETGFSLISGGTDNHLILVDVRGQNLTGKEAERLLDEIGVTVNKNAIPFDPTSPFVTSGIRIGTPALTTRGLKEADMDVVGEIIGLVLNNPQDEAVKARARNLVTELCEKYPLYA